MRASSPRFSICIPCFNHGAYIGRTIESVFQTLSDFEIIIADNASTDSLLSVIQSYRDPRLRVIEKSYNIGFASNLQRASEPASGDFVNLLSSDDVMHPDALATYDELIGRMHPPTSP